MFFPYECQKCEKKFDGEFPVGQAPRETPCPDCKGKSKRVYEGMGFAVKIGGAIDRKSTFGEHMKAKNTQAAYRMQGKKAPVRIAAYDHGGGDVREVKPKKAK